MDYSEFVAVIGAKKTPELTDFERVTVFANSADKDVLWAALGNGGIHPIYQSLVVQALHRRMIEQLEREQAQQRKLEDEARIDATRPAPSRKRSR
ncbi:MAG: hypothetical protein V4673_16650 [Pseudomonadota bacterium]|jgi:D-alanyl-D-alanine dipeptidase